ncbi:SAM-dependent methyltransferase [Vibrio palustris]|uniref:Cyclopropane fatty acyl phospholipid synthase n=1 Tax=Vibrio palustris TaxID=1918946 RepID=A0A1R4B3P0_9VIBR|nr:methyltransferase [Vibrio palustris]SJL83538.1 cyclopropane fatty acyl phospholipid synthase [Vibrio palustris]
MNYKKSEDYNYYYKSDKKSISYSDGTEVEDRIFEIIKSVNDKSVLSDELFNKIDDWPTEYHFSKSRHCLLRPLPIKPGDSVLELGCGCGAMTRYLGEIGAKVDSVEGTHSRARIAAERCKDLPNVNVYVDDLLKFSSEIQYDWVLFIGVLEYAPLFSNKDNPVEHYLNSAKNYLKKDGKLVVAIENKLGLKYFNGCNEDHVNEAYFSIENRYSELTPITFGKYELQDVLNDAGFLDTEFYYPFPDYKLPTAIIHENAFKHDFVVSDVLKGLNARDYSGNNHRVFDESFVWPELEQNKLIEDLSNSFLVIAQYNENKIKNESELAWHYNVNRKKHFTTKTVFKYENDHIVTYKNKLIDNSIKIDNIVLKEVSDEYLSGNTLQTQIENSFHKYKNKEMLLSFYKEWIKFIIDNHSDYHYKKSISGSTIEGDYIDLTPFNIKIIDGETRFFDQEWQSNDRVSLLWIIFRGIYWSVFKLNTTHEFNIEIINEIKILLKEYDEVSDLDIDKVIIKEKEFVLLISGTSCDIDSVINKCPTKYTLLPEDLARCNNKNNELLIQNEFLANRVRQYEKIIFIPFFRKLKNLFKKI